ncbi:MAG: phosphoribosylamine--glycine ligase [Planctomycetota bacterium]
MKVLVVGGGGREHALVWKIARSPKVDRVFCAPGNPGIGQIAECVDLAANDLEGLATFARENRIDLTVVGPEDPLCLGIVDHFQRLGLRCFGPTKAGAELEGSKAWCKSILRKYKIPTAASRTFDIYRDARRYIESLDIFPVVLKASGLAAGKGVSICESREEAIAELKNMMEDKKFGEAGRTILVEEMLKGREASLLAFTDGKTIVPLESAQDHKAAFDGGRGPNTGGMGAYSPSDAISSKVMYQVESQVLVPIVHALYREERMYHGLLYAGLMITGNGPKVLEFNVRFGDPETQPLLMRLKSDIVPIFEAVIDGNLEDQVIEWDPRPAVCVVMASKGYPGPYSKHLVVHGLGDVPGTDDLQVFHAGTELRNRRVVTSGGRVLGVTALGDDLADASRRAYEAVSQISFEGAYYRNDIGRPAEKWTAENGA